MPVKRSHGGTQEYDSMGKFLPKGDKEENLEKDNKEKKVSDKERVVVKEGDKEEEFQFIKSLEKVKGAIGNGVPPKNGGKKIELYVDGKLVYSVDV